MKHGTKLTRRHKILLKEWGLSPENWLVERDTPDEMVVIHRISGLAKTIPMREEEGTWTED